MKEKLRISSDLSGMIFNFRPLFQDFMTQPHQHAELELNLVTSGTASYYFSDVKYTMRPGSMVWILPDQNHRLSQWSSDFSMDIAVFKELPKNTDFAALLKEGLNEGVLSRVMDHGVTQTMHQIFMLGMLTTGGLKRRLRSMPGGFMERMKMKSIATRVPVF